MLKITLMYFDKLTTVCTWHIDFETHADGCILHFIDCDGFGEQWQIPATWVKSIERV